MSDEPNEPEDYNFDAVYQLLENGYVSAPEPTQYKLLHFASVLARQLEAAGVPEANVSMPTDVDAECLHITWPSRSASDALRGLYRASIWLGADGECFYNMGDLVGNAPFRITDPLPADLLTAIRGTADA